jgi:hypothetical protein
MKNYEEWIMEETRETTAILAGTTSQQMKLLGTYA